MAVSSSPPLDLEAEAASDRGAAAGGGISGLDGGAEVGEAEDTPEEEAVEEALPLGAPTESEGDVGSLEEAPSAPAALGGEVAPPPPPPPPRRARRLRRI